MLLLLLLNIKSVVVVVDTNVHGSGKPAVNQEAVLCNSYNWLCYGFLWAHTLPSVLSSLFDQTKNRSRHL